MNQQLEELACLHVLDELTASERSAFEARLSGDPELVAYLRELESALARRIRALPRREPPADLFSRIEARIDRPPVSAPPARPTVSLPSWSSVARWGIAAAVALSAAMIAVQTLRRAPAPAGAPVMIIVGLDSHRSTFAELPLLSRPQTEDARFIQLASLAEQLWEKPGDLPVNLGTDEQEKRSYALFDPGSNHGFIAIRHLPTVEHGRRYHLWMVDPASGQPQHVGVLPLTGSDSGLFSFSIASGAGAAIKRVDFFVTAEDTAAAAPVRPHGTVVLGQTHF